MKQLKTQEIMKKLILLILLIVLQAGCAKKQINSCPEYPMMSEKLAIELDEQAKTNKDLYIWLNRQYILCKKLGTCEAN